MSNLIPQEVIENKIYFIRGHKVMLSNQLAKLYGVEAKVLVQSVKRNAERFPKDFMFQLTDNEAKILKSQFVTSRWGGIRRANPYALEVFRDGSRCNPKPVPGQVWDWLQNRPQIPYFQNSFALMAHILYNIPSLPDRP